MDATRDWSTTEAARLLNQPPHRIIYLFDNQVVDAPVQQAEGRGSSRRLSDRNLLEVAIATTTGRLGMGSETSRKLLGALRAWEQGMAGEGFALPRSVEEEGGPTVRLILDENGRTHVAIGWGADSTTVKGPMKTGARADKAGNAPPRPARAGTPTGFGWPEGSRTCRLEINVTAIAQGLRQARKAGPRKRTDMGIAAESEAWTEPQPGPGKLIK